VRLLLGIALLLALAGGGAYLAAQQKPGVAQGLKPVVVSVAATKSFDQKIDALSAAIADAKKSGKAQPIEVTFTEEELTSKVNQATAQGAGSGIAAQNTEIHLQNGNIVATSTVNVSGVSMNVGVVATPTVVNGQTQLVVKEIQTGALPLPDALKQQLNAQIGNAIDPAKLGLPFDVSQLQVVDGKLVVKGTAKP
jgi:Flp pilus assembly protein TadG